MKNVLLVACATILCHTLFAQNLPIPTRWTITKLGVSFGMEQDMIKNLDYHYMLSSSNMRNPDQFNNIQFREEDYYSGVCENPQVRITATLEVPGMKNTELNLALNGIANRYDGVSYHNNHAQEPFKDEGYEYISITSMTSEVGLESSMTKRLSLGSLNFYGGLGTNMGYSFAGYMNISGHQRVEDVEQNLNRSLADVASGTTYEGNTYDDYFAETLDVKDAFHQRAFVQLGIGLIVFRRLEVGVDYRRGIGYRAVFDGPFRTTQLHSVGATVRWLL